MFPRKNQVPPMACTRTVYDTEYRRVTLEINTPPSPKPRGEFPDNGEGGSANKTRGAMSTINRVNYRRASSQRRHFRRVCLNFY